MFHADYAILTDGIYEVVNDKVLIAIDGRLDQDEVYTLNIVAPGLITPRGGLLITGKSVEFGIAEALELPCIEFLLPDLPHDVLDEIALHGVSIVDARSDIRLEFDMEVSTIA